MTISTQSTLDDIATRIRQAEAALEVIAQISLNACDKTFLDDVSRIEGLAEVTRSHLAITAERAEIEAVQHG